MMTHPQHSDAGRSWYAVWTRSRQEKVAAAMLGKLEVEHFLPLKSEIRQWSDRRQRVEVPLFSGYLFVRVDLARESKLQVLKVPGIGAFVGNNVGSLAIPDRQIEDIRTVLLHRPDCAAEPMQQVEPGDRVRVMRGPLTGVEGTLCRAGSGSRLAISVDMIRQSLTVNVGRDEVELIGCDLLADPWQSHTRKPVHPIAESLHAGFAG